MKSKKDRSVNRLFDTLPQNEKDILTGAGQGLSFDAIDENVVESKANISSQNADTGLASYNPDDTRPYEQKNISSGFHKNSSGSK